MEKRIDKICSSCANADYDGKALFDKCFVEKDMNSTDYCSRFKPCKNSHGIVIAKSYNPKTKKAVYEYGEIDNV